MSELIEPDSEAAGQDRRSHLNLLRVAGYHQFLAMALMGSFEAFWLKELELTERFIGTYLLVLGLSSLGGNVLWGWVADRWGRPARVSALGCFLFGAVALVFPFVRGKWLFLGFALFKGLLLTMASSMLPVLVAAVAERGRGGYTYGQFRIFGSYGFLSATVGLPFLLKCFPAISATLGLVPLQVLFLIGAAAMLVAGLPLLLYRWPTQARGSRVGGGGLQAWRQMLRQPELAGFYVAYFFFALANPAVFAFLTTHAKSLGADTQFIGLLAACLGVVGLTCLRGMGWAADRFQPRYILWAAFAAQPLRALTASLVSDNYAWLMLPQIFHIFTWAGPEVAMIYFLGRLAGEDNRGKALGLAMSVNVLGQIVGAPILGALIEPYGYAFMYRCAAAVSSLGFVVFSLCWWWMRRRTQAAATVVCGAPADPVSAGGACQPAA